jgi:hypothetical protein
LGNSIWAILATGLLMCGTASQRVSATDNTAVGESAAADAIDAEVEFRSTFGLRNDPDYVALASKGGPEFSNLDWGVPLSNDEVAELQRRLDVRESLGPAIAYAIAQPSYAGIYIDQLRGGLPVFLFTDVSSVDASELAGLAGGSTKIEIAAATRTLKELTATKGAISAARDQLRDAGVDITSVSVHVRTNQVEVGVVKPTPDAALVVSEIAPDAVVVDSSRPTLDSCTITSCPPPTGIIGGLEIVQGSDICTAGYVGHRLDVPGTIALVTAGHCVRNGALTWHHNGSTIGTAASTMGWIAGSYGDVGWILLNSSSIPTAKNRALYNPDTNKVVNVVGYRTSSTQWEGDQLCRIGWGSWAKNHNPSDPLHGHYLGLRCGTIVLYDSDSDGTSDQNSQSCVGTTCKWIRDMKVVSFDSTGGDSGGTVFEPTTGTDAVLMGTHVHSQPDTSTSNRGWYTTYEGGRTELADHLGYDIKVCLNAGCTGT